MKIKPCPCGEMPETLHVQDGSTYRWRYITGSCCGEWMLEVRVPCDKRPAEIYRKCVEAWNTAPRATDEDKQ